MKLKPLWHEGFHQLTGKTLILFSMLVALATGEVSHDHLDVRQSCEYVNAANIGGSHLQRVELPAVPFEQRIDHDTNAFSCANANDSDGQTSGFMDRISDQDVLNDSTEQVSNDDIQNGGRASQFTTKTFELPCNLDEVVKTIQSAKNILVVTGAGISASCGIPT